MMVQNTSLALYELSNQNKNSPIILHIELLWLVNSNYASHALWTLGFTLFEQYFSIFFSRLERSLLKQEICNLDAKVNELTRRQTNAQLLKQKTAFDEHILSAKIEMLQNERKELVDHIEREKAAMGKIKANETMLETKVRNLTEINGQIRQELEETARNDAREQEWLVNKEEVSLTMSHNL